ncbi:MAG: FHA domain-containing protein [Chloroflexi bacterium]|nr:FHA domain-containing protein [Chloroflexota bacterium]
MDTQSGFLPALFQPQPVEEDSIEVLNGPEDGRLFSLRGSSAVVGRLESSDVALLLDRSVSGSHARVTREDGRFFIEDLGSTHGTAVNGSAISARTELKDGDEIQIGCTLLRLRRKDR